MKHTHKARILDNLQEARLLKLNHTHNIRPEAQNIGYDNIQEARILEVLTDWHSFINHVALLRVFTQ